MPKKFYKHKLLLDENLPNRVEFPSLNKHFDVKHIRDDFKKDGLPDEDVYAFAALQKRIIITRNIKHFAPLAGIKPDAGIIGIPPHWLPSQLDKKLAAFLMKKSPKALQGKVSTFNEKAGQKKKKTT